MRKFQPTLETCSLEERTLLSIGNHAIVDQPPSTPVAPTPLMTPPTAPPQTVYTPITTPTTPVSPTPAPVTPTPTAPTTPTTPVDNNYDTRGPVVPMVNNNTPDELLAPYTKDTNLNFPNYPSEVSKALALHAIIEPGLEVQKEPADFSQPFRAINLSYD